MTFVAAIRKALTAPQTFRWPQQAIEYKPVCGVSRSAWGRLQNLLAVLRTGESFNCSRLAGLLHLCTKTIQRDINFLRSQGADIQFNRTTNSYQLCGELPPQLNGGAK